MLNLQGKNDVLSVKIGKMIAIFRSKTLTVKNKNINFQNFLSPLIKRTYEHKAKKNSKIFDSKVHTPLIIEGRLFPLTK
jgi:hypothetical protein